MPADASQDLVVAGQRLRKKLVVALTLSSVVPLLILAWIVRKFVLPTLPAEQSLVFGGLQALLASTLIGMVVGAYIIWDVGRTVARIAEMLDPVVALMASIVRESRALHTDATKMPYLDPKVPGKSLSGQMWDYVGDRDHPFNVFDFCRDHSAKSIDAFLQGNHYRGYLNADAHNIYDHLFKSGSIIELGCWAHCRRNFYDAKESDPVRAHVALGHIRQLYAVEAEANRRIAEQKLTGAAADGDADGGWHRSGERTVLFTAGASGEGRNVGGKVTRVGSDGHATDYTWNGSAYVSTEGDGAHDSLTYNTTSHQWTFVDGSTRQQEVYLDSLGSAPGQIIKQIDSTGNQIDFSYSSGLLATIVDHGSGQKIEFAYAYIFVNGTQVLRVSQINTYSLNGPNGTLGAAVREVAFAYNGPAGRLSTVFT